MADEGEAPPPAEAAPPPEEAAPPPAEAAPPPEEAAPPAADAPAEAAPAEVARPSAETAPPPADGAAPPEDGASPPVAATPGAGKPSVQFTSVEQGEDEGGQQFEEAEPPMQEGDGQFEDEEGEGEISEKKSMEAVREESDSNLSIDEDNLDHKDQEIERKRAKALGSTISIRKGNQEFLDRSKAPKYMNSYKLDSDKPFNNEKVEIILKEVLSEIITDDLVYDADKVMKQAKWASGVIRDKVKEQEYDRYKIVCVVTIGEKRSQDVFSVFRFLWDCERDRFATYVHENMRIYAVALCFGLYYE